ncbi:MAG: hypothetical protein U0271_04485 [Polyangiaceae bacterium]
MTRVVTPALASLLLMSAGVSLGCGSKKDTSSTSNATTSSASTKDSASPTTSANSKSTKSEGGGTGKSLEDIPDGTYVADNGFRPAKHGYNFPNRGDTESITIKTAREIFGDEAVCQHTGHNSAGDGRNAAPSGGKNAVQGIDLDGDGVPDIFYDDEEAPAEPGALDPQPQPEPQPTAQDPSFPQPNPSEPVPRPEGVEDCVPTPGAQAWINKANSGAGNGVCEGMAVSSLMMYKGLLEPASFQTGATQTFDLERSEAVRSVIGKYFSYQYSDPTDSETRVMRNKQTPNEVLDTISERLKSTDPEEQVTLGFYQRGKGGHAVVPYAVEDKGNGIFWLRIYDNNAPGVTRYLEFDRNKNTWIYGFGAVNPQVAADKWMGDASTFSLDWTPLKLRRSKPVCSWCKENQQEKQVFSPDNGDVLIKDDKGHAIGFENGQYVNTMPNAGELFPRAYVPGGKSAAPVFVVPSSGNYSISIDGNGKGGSDDVAIFGDGIAITIDDIKLAEDQVDTVFISEDGRSLKYSPGEKESPDIRIALDGADADYLFAINDLDAQKGEAIELDLDPSTGRLKVFDTGGGGDAFDLDVVRFAADGKVDVYQNDDIPLEAGEAAGIDFGSWSGNGQALKIEEDKGNDGSWDSFEMEADEK